MTVRPLATIAALLPTVAFGAVHYDTARVIDAQPMYETVQVNTPREVCRQAQYAVAQPARNNAAIPVIGAVIGGVLANGLGHDGGSRKVATAAGAIMGGAVGMSIASRQAQAQPVTRYETRQMCTVENHITTEENLIGYRVRYRYQGQVYVMETDRHPGDTVRVRVDVTPAL